MTGAFLPICLSLVRHVPWPRTLVSWINTHIIYPPLVGNQQKQPPRGVFGWIGLVPTRGQALFIFYLVAINVILSGVSIWTIMPHSWYGTKGQQIMADVANRTGVLSFANLPLLILFSSRNNFLFQVTDWSQSTFLLLHRWAAGIAATEAAIHSVLYLEVYVVSGTSISEARIPYWYIGILATIAMCILLPMSILKFRQAAYELFLALHIILAVLSLVGCYYHIIWRFDHQWGYETWIVMASVIWGFDRAVRILRMSWFGLRMASITAVDDDYVRIDIPRIRANGHVYLFFPTLSWRVWENHPFSVAASAVPPTTSAPSLDETAISETPKTMAPTSIRAIHSAPSIDHGQRDAGMCSSDLVDQRVVGPAKLGLTFVVRRQKGMTAMLMARKRVPVLIEGSYGHHSATSSLAPNVVCIAGGVGITAVLPYMRACVGVARLYWGVRNVSIVDTVADLTAGLDKQVLVGTRVDVTAVLTEEIRRAGSEGITVIVSGPSDMSDEARMAVIKLGHETAGTVNFIDESFSW